MEKVGPICICLLIAMGWVSGAPPPTEEVDGKVVGGVKAKKDQIPYQVALEYQTNDSRYRQFCGGSLVGDGRCVVTAAHCVKDFISYPNALFVVAGSTSLQSGTRYAVSDVQIHPNYFQRVAYNNDIAVVKLVLPVANSSDAMPIRLPKDRQVTAAGTIARVSGWGKIREGGSGSQDLLYAEVPVLSEAACRSRYRRNQITDSMLCAGLARGGKDSCQGDSGGPLAIGSGPDATLIGVVSWGNGCARAAYPGVYTKVSHMLGFLKSQNCVP